MHVVQSIHTQLTHMLVGSPLECLDKPQKIWDEKSIYYRPNVDDKLMNLESACLAEAALISAIHIGHMSGRASEISWM